MSSQQKQRDGFVSLTFNDGTKGYYWRNQYVETVKYEYLDDRFDLTSTKITTNRAKVDQEGLNLLGGYIPGILDVVETEIVKKDFHYSGYMMKKTVSSTVLDYFISSTREDALSGAVGTLYRYPVYKTIVTTETYKPLGRGRWLKEVVTEAPRSVRTVRDAADPKWDSGEKYGVSLEAYGDTIYTSREETDTPPEYASRTPDTSSTSSSSDVICIEEPSIIKNGYSYDEPVKFVLYTSGRGAPITIKLPFLQAAPGISLTSTLSGLAEKYLEVNKLINKVRTNGTFFVPVVPERYGQATSVNISISDGTCEVDVTMEATS